MKGVMRFRTKGKFSPRYIGPYQIMRKISSVAYELDLPMILASVRPAFHASMLKKCVGDHSFIVSIEDIGVKDFLSYKEMEPSNRSWMYNMTLPNHAGLKEEYKEGVAGFFAKAMTLDEFLTEGTIRCPCEKCECPMLLGPDDVEFHLLKNGFMKNYYVWTVHGETNTGGGDYGFENSFIGEGSPIAKNNAKKYRYSETVRDVFGTHSGDQSEPNDKAKHFYEQLNETSHPLYEGSMHSKLSVAVRLLSIKSDYFISQESMDSIIALMNNLNPNKFDLPKDYYTSKKLVSKLGLSSEKIDCCEKGCMLFYKDDATLEYCKFCNQPRYKEVTNAKGKKVPEKWIHYLPVIPWLKRPSPLSSSAYISQNVEEMKEMRKKIAELKIRCNTSDDRVVRFEKLIMKYMPQACDDEDDTESDED
ncbi:putative subtilisin-like protease SDD1-like [Capsicum annuum]|uniref:Uncharacterized protein n=1 Tax=Capsicum annuum TaxID=4072 RepID=A0A2G2Y798_CAPAN|nr:putative subtilisin-like protease SDD1-like [Capsicum annuum]KAF3667556.1 putative subtilisin-like protease SDD1-like [Capsicum annuum]PHT65636.1 hypothetical protein T459_30061 [Capsicum annuum]